MAKISLLLPDLRGGGAERLSLVLAYEFKELGHQVEFVLMQPQGELLEEARNSFAVVDLGVKRIRSLPYALARYLRANKPDALLVGMWPITGIAAAITPWVSPRTRVVISEHVDFRMSPSLKRVERLVLGSFGKRIYRCAAGVVAVSQGVADSLVETARLDPAMITVIHNPQRPVPTGELSSNEKACVSGWLSADVRLIAIGSLKRQKDFGVALRALARLRESINAHLLILGEGELRESLIQDAKTLGVAESLTLHGFRENIHDYLREAHCFVLSSAWEGFGNVIVEALSTGCPVVSTDCRSGPAEILENGRYGHLVPVGNPDDLADAVLKTLNEPPDKDILVARSQDFLPEGKAEQYIKLLIGNS